MTEGTAELLADGEQCCSVQSFSGSAGIAEACWGLDALFGASWGLVGLVKNKVRVRTSKV